jgi:hypothetical protein
MARILHVLPKICYAMAAILFVTKSYFIVEVLRLGYFPGLDMTRDIAPQVAKAMAQVVAESLVWVIFGLVVGRQNSLEKRMNALSEADTNA